MEFERLQLILRNSVSAELQAAADRLALLLAELMADAAVRPIGEDVLSADVGVHHVVWTLQGQLFEFDKCMLVFGDTGHAPRAEEIVLDSVDVLLVFAGDNLKSYARWTWVRSDAVAAMLRQIGPAGTWGYHPDGDADTRAVLWTVLQELLSRAGARRALIIRRCALPRWFDQDVLAVLRERPDQNERVLAELANYTFVLQTSPGTYVYHKEVRLTLLQQWRQDNPAELHQLNQALGDHFARRASEAIRQEHESEPRSVGYVHLWQAMVYHYLAGEPDRGLKLLEAGFDRALARFSVGEAEEIIQIAEQVSRDIGSPISPAPFLRRLDHLTGQLSVELTGSPPSLQPSYLAAETSGSPAPQWVTPVPSHADDGLDEMPWLNRLLTNRFRRGLAFLCVMLLTLIILKLTVTLALPPSPTPTVVPATPSLEVGGVIGIGNPVQDDTPTPMLDLARATAAAQALNATAVAVINAQQTAEVDLKATGAVRAAATATTAARLTAVAAQEAQAATGVALTAVAQRPSPVGSQTPLPRSIPTLMPLPRLVSRFVPSVTQTYAVSDGSGQRSSCVQGQVIGRGVGIAGAVVGLNNGVYFSQTTTNTSGEFQFCGLGRSDWSLVLFYVPSRLGNLQRQPVQTFFVNGDSEQIVRINFIEL